MDFRHRSTEYGGVAETNSTVKASLEDILPMGGLAPDVKIAKIMETESELLCYKY